MAHEEAIHQAPATETNTAPTAEKIPIPTGSEHVKQTKYRETAMGDVTDILTVPDAPTPDLHNEAYFVENVEGIPKTTEPVALETKNDNKNKKPLWVKAAAGVGALAVAGVAVFMAHDNGSDKNESKPAANSLGNAAPALPGQESGPNNNLPPLDMYSSDITREDYGRQLNVALPFLQRERSQSLKEVVNEITSENRVPLDDPSQFPAGSIERKAQEDQNNITADLWTISKQQNTVLARNLLNAVFQNDPNTTEDAFDLNAKLIGNGKGNMLEPTQVLEVSPVISEGSLAGVKITGQPTYLVQLASRRSGKIYEQVISQRYSQGGDTSGDVVVKSIQYGEPEYINKPSSITR